MSWVLLVLGAPRTKKNHGAVIIRGKRKYHVPSAAWMTWVATAQISTFRPTPCAQWPDSTTEYRFLGARPLTDIDVNCRALFYRDADRGDAVGYYQGLADLLQKRGVIVNDVQLVSWDGSRLLKDAERPRVEIELTPAAGPED